MYKAYAFIQKNRWRKKRNIYQLFFAITLDLTTIMYVAAMVGYTLFSFYQVGEAPQFVKQLLIHVTHTLNHTNQFILLSSFFPIYFMMRSFQRPGVMFSSAKSLLSILPHDRHRLWFLSFVTKLGKIACLLYLGAFLLWLVTPLSFGRLSLLALWVLFVVFSMTIIQWKLYQLHIGIRIALLVLTSVLSTLYALTNLSILLILYLLFLSSLFLYATYYRFTAVDWSRVMAASDFQIWHMPLISQATKVKFQKDEQPSLWYRLESWKKPFPYKKEHVYHRLWYIYGEKEIGLILRMTGALFSLILVVSYFHPFYYTLVVAVAIHIQASLFVSLFKNRLYIGLLNVLPWDLVRFQQTFMSWAMLMSLVLLIPTGFYALFHFEHLFIYSLVYIGMTFYAVVFIRLRKCMHELDGHYPPVSKDEFVIYLLLLILMGSAFYPYILILGFLIMAARSSSLFQLTTIES